MLRHVADDHAALVVRAVPAIGQPSDPANLAQAKLKASPYLALRTLTCDSHEGVLAVRGQVPTFFLKQMAQSAVRDVPGVEEINNQVLVVPPSAQHIPTAPR
jgi:osmotically-inducible protein OsmY